MDQAAPAQSGRGRLSGDRDDDEDGGGAQQQELAELFEQDLQEMASRYETASQASEQQADREVDESRIADNKRIHEALKDLSKLITQAPVNLPPPARASARASGA